MIPSEMQKEIIDFKGNLVVSASAGTGKTFTMVEKIAKEIAENTSHKVIAAITFTIKAAHEIKDRLTIDIHDHFIGTNNSFAIEEIIKPFMKDVYGLDFDIDMTTDYSCKIGTYEKAIDKIKAEHKIYSYCDSKKNFVFDLALYIVKNSKACRLYLQAKYFKLYIDEYQDCDKSMHDFFMYLCDKLQIETFIVGDEKQSIYMWRGAYPQAFKDIRKKTSFSYKFMSENYRSCKQIQNYSNLLCEETKKLYRKLDTNNDILLINTNKSNWGKDIASHIDMNMTTAILRYSNNNAENNSKIINDIGMDCVYIPQLPIADITTNSAWMFTAIAKYLILKKYSVFDFIMDIPVEVDETRTIVKKIEGYLQLIKDNTNDENNFYNALLKFANYLDYNITKEHSDKLFETIDNEIYHSAFSFESYSNVALTFHSSKGLEFEQVIIFAEDYNLNDEQSIYNHYVACTRAKNKLIIVYTYDNENSKSYINNLKKIFNENKVELKDVIKKV